MTVAAIQTETADVMLVAERDGLLSRYFDSGSVGRKIEGRYPPHHASKQEHSASDTSSRYGIRSRTKKLSHASCRRETHLHAGTPPFLTLNINLRIVQLRN